MDKYEQFWVAIWKILTTTLTGLVLGCYMFHTINNQINTEALTKVSDPIAYNCAKLIADSTVATGELALCMEKAKK